MATIKDGKGTVALAAYDNGPAGVPTMHRWEIGRPKVGPQDVDVDIKFCGICHSDLHTVNGEWGINMRPMAPGHEISGIVRTIGSEVKGLKVGDKVGVGCMVESCQSCHECKQGLEQHCQGMVMTYASVWAKGKGHDDCALMHTNGGYSESITVHQRFVFKLPDGIPLEKAGPILCAGVTTYSPLARHVLGKKDVVCGVVGFGGLGHMAVKIAIAMGAKVTVFSRDHKKKKEVEALGASLIAYTDLTELVVATRTFDVIIDTVPTKHDIMGIIECLKVEGALVLVGAPATPLDLGVFPLLMARRRVEGSLIAGCPETEETLAFCAKHKILPTTKTIHAKDVTEAYHTLIKGDAADRFVIDISTLKEMPAYTHVPAKKTEAGAVAAPHTKRGPLLGLGDRGKKSKL
eukprot:g3886.t1